MGEVGVALGGLKPSHIPLARVGNLDLICEVDAFGEERRAILCNRPYAHPIGEDDTLMSSGGRSNPLRLGRFDGWTAVWGWLGASTTEMI